MIVVTRWTCIMCFLGLLAGCAPQAGDTPQAVTVETVPASFNSANAPTVEFSVPDMMCPDGCGEKTKEILAEQPGAKDVLIDFDAKTATVAIEDDAFDAQQAIAALVDHGFDQSTLKDDASAKPPLGRELGAERQAADAPVVQ